MLTHEFLATPIVWPWERIPRPGPAGALRRPCRHHGMAGIHAPGAGALVVVTLGWKIGLHCATVPTVWGLIGSPVALMGGILLVVLLFDLFVGTV